MLDLFTTRRNRKLPLYVSPVPVDQAWAEDALAIDCTGLQTYAYPLISIMSKVLKKILMKNCLLVLIAPAWPTQSWFCHLLETSMDHPLRFPLSPRLLKQMKPFFHSNPGHLKLRAWKVQGGIFRNKGSVKNFLRESPDLNANPPGNYMEQDGTSFVLDASPRKEILSRPFPP